MSQTDNDALAKLMGPVALKLYGTPNKALSTKDELRFGSHGSLSVDLVKGTWYRHGENAGGGVLALVEFVHGAKGGEAVKWLRENGFEVPDRAPPAKANGHANGNAHANGSAGAKPKIVATYDYVDEAGNFLFQVCRFEPKDFRQRRRPTPSDAPEKIKGGWVWSTKGCRQVPYRLPELIDAIKAGMTIFAVEGEKDADRLWSIGVPATTNAQGAGKWPEGMEQFFADADVVLLPDNDPQSRREDGSLAFHKDGRPVFPGQDHAELAGERIVREARRVRVLELPGLLLKGDATDWIEAGGDADALYDLVDREAQDLAQWLRGRPAAPFDQSSMQGEIIDPSAPFVSRFSAIPWSRLNDPGPEHEWLIEDIITRGEVAMMAGPSGSGKSFLAVDLSLSIVRGVPWFGNQTMHGGVVYQAGEGRNGLRKRLRAYMIEHGLGLENERPFVLLPSPVDLYASDDQTNFLIAETKHWAKSFERRLELVVIDTLAAASSGADENSSRDMGPILARCARIAQECDCAVLLVHHMNAGGQKARGWTGIQANVDSVIGVAKTEPPQIDIDRRHVREFTTLKQKDGEDGKRWRFVLPAIETSRGNGSKALTSCVVRLPNWDGEPGEKEKTTDAGLRLTPQIELFLRAIYRALDDDGERAPPELRLPLGTQVVRWNKVTQAFAALAFEEESEAKKKADKLAQATKRAGERLMQLRIIGREKPFVWLTGRKVKGMPKRGGTEDEAARMQQELDQNMPAGMDSFLDEGGVT